MTAAPALHRLQTRAQFQAALAGGTIARTPHFALHRCTLKAPPAPASSSASASASAREADEAPRHRFVRPLFDPADAVWIGAMVPKRWARRAVTRNAIKRQVYELSAGLSWLPTSASAAHVVRLRSAFDRQRFVSATSAALKQAVRAELLALFDQAARA